MFSKACEYAIRATIYIAQQSLEDKRVSLKAISNEIDSPVAFTAKILQQLTRNKIVTSVMGPTGGFQMDKERIDEVKLSKVVDTIDGDSIYRGCGLGLKECDASRPCPVHDRFAKIRDDLQKMLVSTSIFELATGLDVGLTFLKR
ncbi:MAG: Rrf2 family transcriptional regulator [Cyclobacteriaceae bacterium]